MAEEVLKMHRENATKNTIHTWLQPWQWTPLYPNRGKENNYLVMTYIKHKEITNILRILSRKPGRQVNFKRASRERREETIQLTRQTGVITVASHTRKAHG